MRLLSLQLAQFRDYSSLEVSLPEVDLHLFAGPNGSGKTNLLEAVSVLSLTKSPLGAEEDDVVRWGTDFYRVTGKVRTDAGEERTLEVVSQMYPRRQKACFVNDVRTSVSDMVGRLPVVLFLPQDLELFSGPPAGRRRFLDQILCQMSPQYLHSLSRYQQLIRQRNALLRNIAAGRSWPEELKVWDLQLAQEGSRITLARLELIETFNLTIVDEVRSLEETWEDVRISYDRSGHSRQEEELTRELLALLASERERDVLLQSTGSGPHRDDWRVAVSGRELSSFASRGQQRVTILALLFLETSYLELRRSEKPVILLDDIFSELDARHQQAVLEVLQGHQVLLTATRIPDRAGKAALSAGAIVWEVREGTIAAVVQRG